VTVGQINFAPVPGNLLACMSEADQRRFSRSGRTPAEAREAAVAKDERELQRQIANYLRLHGIWFTQSRMDRRTSNTVGTPDFIFCYRGRFVAWEVKCPWAPALRPEQRKAAHAIVAAGGEWRLVTSLAEGKEHLEKMEEKN
jgi:hypothetical protein